MDLTLARALRVSASPCVAFMGAGGKTTAMFQLARQLTSPVIVTATAHLGVWQGKWADQHIIAKTPAPLEELEHGEKGVFLVTGEIESDKIKPIHNDLLKWLKEFCSYHSIPLLIEADGARGKPLKAWAGHEPPIPAFVETVVQVAGLTGLGKPLNDENIHRSQLFSKLSGLKGGELITTDSVARVLTSPEGGLKNIPINARRAVLLNQADASELQASAQGLAKALLPAYHSAIVSSLEQEKIFAVHEPVAAIVLAAGESRRFGEPKQLLDWKGQPFVRAVAQTALESKLGPVIVITGANAEPVERSIRDLNILTIRNDSWEEGQASSIKAGVHALTTHPALQNTGAAIFLLADQPHVASSIMRALVEKHAQGLYPVVAPMVMDQRANPVLFDRITFPDLLLLEGDIGGRAIFHKHRVEYLPWHDERLLLDVDTPEMYRRLNSEEPL